MNRPELYEKTVNVLLDAYNDGELEHQNCCACAVGNICKEASEKTRVYRGRWLDYFLTSIDDGSQKINEARDERDAAYKLIKQTGYTIKELARVEWAFEKEIAKELHPMSFKDRRNLLEEIRYSKEYQFRGLCRVLDVLKEIHSTEEKTHEENIVKLTEIKNEKCSI